MSGRNQALIDDEKQQLFDLANYRNVSLVESVHSNGNATSMQESKQQKQSSYPSRGKDLENLFNKNKSTSIFKVNKCRMPRGSY